MYLQKDVNVPTASTVGNKEKSTYFLLASSKLWRKEQDPEPSSSGKNPIHVKTSRIRNTDSKVQQPELEKVF